MNIDWETEQMKSIEEMIPLFEKALGISSKPIWEVKPIKGVPNWIDGVETPCLIPVRVIDGDNHEEIKEELERTAPSAFNWFGTELFFEPDNQFIKKPDIRAKSPKDAANKVRRTIGSCQGSTNTCKEIIIVKDVEIGDWFVFFNPKKK
tara:strand:+ start:380 stop:826 length:447 start_codon:yes stop_codon:yes gene_type:complete